MLIPTEIDKVNVDDILAQRPRLTDLKGGGDDASESEASLDSSEEDTDQSSSEEDNDSDDSDDDDSDDDEEELQRELERIRAERETEKRRREEEDAKLAEEEAKQAASLGNPLMPLGGGGGMPKSALLKRRWNDDVVFRNQGTGEPDKKKRFVNDTVRNDFHRQFISRYMK